MMLNSALVAGLVALVAHASVSAQAVPQARPEQARPAQAKTDEQGLIQLERDWDAAFQRQDVRFIESILAAEFIATYGDGTRADKAREVALATDFNQQIDSRVLDEFTVKVFGETAVVWFTQRLTGPKQGKPVTVTYKYTDVFVRRGGRWLAVASHSTRAGERPAS
jgi:ketosteroid isomerase-like protein